MSAFTLGQRVSWATLDELHRLAVSIPDEFGHSQTHKVWISQAEQGLPVSMAEPREGIVVGTRVLSNGRLQWNGYDEPVEYILTDTVTAVLVAYDLRRKPVLIPPHRVREV